MSERPTTAARPARSARPLVSYVLPVYNEEANVGAFHEALVRATSVRPDLRFGFIYVDDGSRDASLDQVLALRSADHRVNVLSFSRNYGHQITVTAGLDAAADADAVIIRDTDRPSSASACSCSAVCSW